MDVQSKNRVSLSIMGEEYVLKGSSPPEQMLEVGRYVDKLMRTLAESNVQMSRHKIAVLAALNLADELFKAKPEKYLVPAEGEEPKTDHELV